MKSHKYKFSSGTTELYFYREFGQLEKLTDPEKSVLVTDENVFAEHGSKLEGWNIIILKAGEEFKVQQTVDSMIEKLVEMEVDRTFTLVGVGGGVITDLTGFVASIYMRGIRFGFVPTTILGLVDASIGGKNGIDVGVYKNIVGAIRQPAFILHDLSFLSSLPEREWVNGFAEVIKHACICDKSMFEDLAKNNIKFYRDNKDALSELIERNARIKIGIVKKDEFERDQRRLLNFGHTLGHALENQYELMHGEAISIGMTYAAHISEEIIGFTGRKKVVKLLDKYGLPNYAEFDKDKVFAVMKMDKKRAGKEMNYILLEKIGKAVVKPISLKKLETIIRER